MANTLKGYLFNKMISAKKKVLVRSKNRILANYHFNQLETLEEDLRIAKIFCKPENYYIVKDQIIQKLWDIRNDKKIKIL